MSNGTISCLSQKIKTLIILWFMSFTGIMRDVFRKDLRSAFTIGFWVLCHGPKQSQLFLGVFCKTRRKGRKEDVSGLCRTYMFFYFRFIFCACSPLQSAKKRARMWCGAQPGSREADGDRQLVLTSLRKVTVKMEEWDSTPWRCPPPPGSNNGLVGLRETTVTTYRVLMSNGNACSTLSPEARAIFTPTHSLVLSGIDKK